MRRTSTRQRGFFKFARASRTLATQHIRNAMSVWILAKFCISKRSGGRMRSNTMTILSLSRSALQPSTIYPTRCLLLHHCNMRISRGLFCVIGPLALTAEMRFPPHSVVRRTLIRASLQEEPVRRLLRPQTEGVAETFDVQQRAPLRDGLPYSARAVLGRRLEASRRRLP